MTRDGHIRDVYAEYVRGRLTFDDVIAAADRALAEYQQQRGSQGDLSDEPARRPANASRGPQAS